MSKRVLHSWMERLGFNRSRAVTSTAGKSAGRFALETLEPRYLLSADVGGVLAYPALAGIDALVQPAVIAAPLLNADSALDTTGSAASAATGTRHEVVIVDTGVKGHERLIEDLLNTAGANRQLDVYRLDIQQDGIGQISAILAGYRNLDAVHILSHGSDAELQLGNTLLTGANLKQYAEQIAGWRTALGTQADLLFYGCDLAAHPDGVALVNALSSLTGAAVAASTDMTGTAALGGNWQLEYATGTIETSTALSAQTAQNWMGLLANTAPMLTLSASGVSLNPVAQDAGPPVGAVGTLVSDLVDLQGGGGRDNVSDPDAGALTGIAVTDIDTTKGTAFYTKNGGVNWFAMGNVADNSARLLSTDANTRIYFQPNSGFNGVVSAAVQFHAWDRTGGISNGQPGINTQPGGLTSAFSTAKEVASLAVGHQDPTITFGNSSNLTMNDTATISPFLLRAVTIDDANTPALTLTVTVTLDTAAKGTFTTLSGFSNEGNGAYSFTGTAAAATAALRGLVFAPTENRVTPTQTETTTFTISADDGVAAVTDNSITVVSTSVNDAPTITGTASDQSVTDKTTVTPFSNVSIDDADNPAQNLAVTVRLDDAAKGSLSNLAGFTEGPAGSYTFTGSAAAATAAIRGLVFTPSENRVAPTLIETTTFTLSVTDNIAPTVVDSMTTVDSTSINDVPVIGRQNFAINDNVPDGSTASTLTSSDPDSSDTRRYAITGGNAASAFAIDPVTGEIRVADGRVLRSNSAPTMTLVVTVTDANGLSATTAVTVTVNPLAKINNTITNTVPAPTPHSVDTAASPPPDEQSATGGNTNDKMTGTGRLFPGGHGMVAANAGPVKTVSGPPTPVVAAEHTQAVINTDKNATVMAATQAPISIRSAGAGVLSSLIANASFTRELDTIRDATLHQITLTKVTAGVSIATTTGLSVGYVAWLVRGGALLSSVLSSLPAWRMIDPLPILAFARNDKTVDDDDDSLEAMVRKGNLEQEPTAEA